MKHRVSQRTPMVEIHLAIIRTRTKIYCRSTLKSIITVEDILWSFPEKYSQKQNDREKWKWSEVKRHISRTMNVDMAGEWELNSTSRPGSVKRWNRIRNEATAQEGVKA
jgi:hypothetical protein